MKRSGIPQRGTELHLELSNYPIYPSKNLTSSYLNKEQKQI
jgi:hypothetical protein